MRRTFGALNLQGVSVGRSCGSADMSMKEHFGDSATGVDLRQRAEEKECQ